MENKQENHDRRHPSRRSKSSDLPGLQEKTTPTEENCVSYAHLREKSRNDVQSSRNDSSIPESLRSGSDSGIEKSHTLSGSRCFSYAPHSVNYIADDPENNKVFPHLKAEESSFCGRDRDLSTHGGNVNIPRRPRGFLKRANSSSFVREPPNLLASISGSRSPAGNSNLSTQAQFLAGKRKKRYNDKENGSSRCNSAESSKEIDFSLLKIYKKAKRSLRRRPNASIEKIEQISSETHPFGVYNDDDEESLEENAARMLSSRFDPRYTEDSEEKSTYSLNSRCKSSSSSSSSSSSLSPREVKKKGYVARERHFYEVCTRAFDPYWVLKRRISIFWPLDQSWYLGLVKDYNPMTKMHQVKYDDREEEWINLQGERFKLLLLPNEFMSKFCRSKIDWKLKEECDDGSGKVMDVLESEPIISWLARSTKRLKASNSIKWAHAIGRPSVIKPNGSKDITDVKILRDKANCYDDMKFTHVYSRRRSRQKGDKDRIFDREASNITLEQINKTLKLILPLQWFSPLKWLSEYTWIQKIFLLYHHGKLLPLWPPISMEILFLDNTLGLRFLSLKGDLLHAVKVLCLFIRIFHRMDWGGKFARLELPWTSIGLKLSPVEAEGQRIFFYVYKFFCTGRSQWLYMERKLKQLSVKIKVLALSESTHADLKKLFCANDIRLFNRKRNQKMLYEGHTQHPKIYGQAENHPLSLSTSPSPSSFLFLHFNFLAEKKASLKSLAPALSINGNSQIHHGKRQHHKRKRPNNTKDTGVDLDSCSKKSVDTMTCKASVLVTTGDRGWRENNAHVIVDSDDQKDWKIVVKVSGAKRYFYKPHQLLQQGATNRFTHAMLWKGGKDWTLEFTDRKEWSIFKEIYQECCDFNLRAASLRHIPIPGVSLIEDYDALTDEMMPFVRSSNYFRQNGSEVDMALDQSRIVYDLDSEDEEWISKLSDSDGISEEMVEKMIDILEKEAFSQRRIEFEESDIQGMMDEVMSVELVKNVYEYWLQKRRRKGIPLIREFQPPLWKQYQQQLREWESEKSKIPNSLNDVNVRAPSIDKSKPPVFAFCLRPRGLELPKYAKQRSHKKLPFFQGKRASGPSLSREKSTKDFHTARQKLERCPGQTEELMAKGAVNSAQHLSSFARFKREKAHWLMHRADLAIHRAVSILMTAEVMELGEEDETETESSDLGGVGRGFSGVVPSDDCTSSSFRRSKSSSSEQEDGPFAVASP